ncbi:MAG: hypothetical protein EPO28_05050 [Saprospiraceae bacterium]|nr:MAG: hypothetical protein EPO28_05050 [Saprospiraceae bacterium]
MAGKNENNQTAQMGEISTLRNILMGQQMAEYEARFARMEEEMAATKAQFSKELSALGALSAQHLAQLEKAVNERFDRLEKMINENIGRLDAKLLEVSKTDKSNLGQMLADLSKKLIVE